MNRIPLLRTLIPGLPLLFILSGCLTLRDYGELPAPEYVDIEQITKVWYVQGYLPTVADQKTFDATYEFDRRRDGSLRIIYTFNAGAHDGPIKEYEFKAEIDDTTTNADWTLQLVWPFQSDFRIVYAASDYSTLVVGHPNRKYLYILSDDKQMPRAAYQWLLDYVASQGYNTSYIREVPQV